MAKKEPSARLKALQEKVKDEVLPEIDVVSTLEVYRVKEGEREKRICGHSLDHLKKGKVCMMPAGRGTSHVGIGRCRNHDGNLKPATDNYWVRMNQAMGVPVDLQELYERADGIGKHELYDPLAQMRRLSALYWYILNNPEIVNKDTGETALSHWQLQELRKHEELIVKATDMIRKAEGQTEIKGVTIVKFVQGIFDIVYKTVGKEKGRHIVNQISKLVYMHHEEGKIKGDVNPINDAAIAAEVRHEKHQEKVEVAVVEDGDKKSE